MSVVVSSADPLRILEYLNNRIRFWFRFQVFEKMSSACVPFFWFLHSNQYPSPHKMIEYCFLSTTFGHSEIGVGLVLDQTFVPLEIAYIGVMKLAK